MRQTAPGREGAAPGAAPGAPARYVDVTALLFGVEVRDFERAVTTLNRTTRERTPVMPDGCKIIDLSYKDSGIKAWAQTFLKLWEVDVFATADPAISLGQIIDAVRGKIGPAQQKAIDARATRVTQIHDNLREGWRELAKDERGILFGQQHHHDGRLVDPRQSGRQGELLRFGLGHIGLDHAACP